MSRRRRVSRDRPPPVAPGRHCPPTRPPNSNANAERAAPPACLADPAWLAAQYETKSAQQIARDLRCRREAVYEALHAAGSEMRANGHYPKPPGQIPPEVAERAVVLYLAGASLKAVAAQLRLKVEHVSRLVEERGVKRSRGEVAALAGRAPISTPRNEWPAELATEVLERYAAASPDG